jgi:MoxR-like ATPase
MADLPEPVEEAVSDDTLDTSGDDASTAQQLMQQVAKSSLTDPITDPMDKRLDHLRPLCGRGSKVARYISRTMKNGKSDIETLLAYASDENRRENEGYAVSFALKGPTQSGKTLIVQKLAEKLSEERGLPKPMPIYTLSGSAGVTDYDFFGQPVSMVDERTGRDRIVHLPGTVEMWAQTGGLLYVDEINAIPPRYAISLNPVLDHRHEFTNRGKAIVKGGVVMAEFVRLHEDCWVITTYNEGYEDMAKMNKSLHQRFDHILWDYDPVVEHTLIKNENLHRLAEAFRTAYQNRKINIPVSTALLQRIQRNIGIHGVEMALEIFLGMFDERHRITADEILNAQTIRSSLLEDEKQARYNAEAAAAQFAPMPDPNDPLAQALGGTP